jgi:hypothetical protein
MQAASELLGLTPPAPLSAVLVARPVRACVFVPAVQGVAWQRLVEHALAAQTRIWGGTYNLVVPTGWEIGDDELFWRLIDRFDPDVVALHAPTHADVEGIAPEMYADWIAQADQQLRDLGFGDETRSEQISRVRKETRWGMDPSPALRAKLVARVAPLRLGDDPRTVYINGISPPPYPLTDVASLRELPASVLDVGTILDDVDRLMLTHAVGRLLPSFRSALEERTLTIHDVRVEHQEILFDHLWPRGRVVTEYGYPRLLAELGLARRLFPADRDRAIVVVGDEPRDFLLYHGLSRLRPYVYWLPAARLNNQVFVTGLAQAARRVIRMEIGGGDLAVTTASSDDAAVAAVALLNGLPGRDAPDAALVEWQATIPRSYMWAADAKSERRVLLLRHEGETQELQTPTPVSVSVSPESPSELRWMVDVDVQGWRPARHSALGTQVIRGPVVTDHDARTSTGGPSYFGQGPFVQAFLGLEGSTARPRLRPRTVVEQARDVLQPLGWEVASSDKGSYAVQSARLLHGIEGLASALRSEPTRALLDAYLTPTATNNPGIYLSDTRRRYFSLDEAGGVVGEADVPTLVADLYDRGALVRGHVLKCEHCRATSFYSLSEEQRFICVRCRTSQRATRFSWLEKPEPEFRYALSEVLFQFLTNKGQLPLLAAYDHFVVGRGREREPFDMACELELTSPEGQLREHDIVATWGAELWLGEATFEGKLEDANAEEVVRLERLRESAQALCARGVLFVTTSDGFRERTKQNVSNVFPDPAWPEVVYAEGFDSGAVAAA